MAQYTISIIIPVLNEAKIIKQTLEQLVNYSQVEVIVVDGVSQDDTVAIAQSMAKVAVVNSIPLCKDGAPLDFVRSSRAEQMNTGADLAQSDILLFLHADTQLPKNFIELVTKTLEQKNTVAGAFKLKIDAPDKSLRWIERLVKVRSHLFSLPYGDQAIFVAKKIFIEAGGFANLPIMEDFEFIQRVKKMGKVAIAPAAVTTSARRWQKLGVWQTTLINQVVIAGYYLGISPSKLSKFYRGRVKKAIDKKIVI